MLKNYVSTCFMLICLFAQAQNNINPNIIFILADDLGYGDLSCYGSHKIHTPNIDQMAKEGLKFNNFYAASAVCTPTRVSILTGNYPLRYNVSTHFNDKEMYLNNTMPTLPKVLKKQGYVSKHIGKWHLGGLNEKHIKNRKSSMPGPLEHGFDSYLAMLEDPLYRAPAMREKRLYKDAGLYLCENDLRIKPNKKHWTQIKFEAAASFIKAQHKKKKTFFLNLWLDAPHAPYESGGKSHLKKYQDKAKGDDLLYRSMVSRLDTGVGNILKLLKKLDIDKNTLVVFTSDNGPAYQGSSAYLKGRKTDLYEGGIRVPGIFWWPSKIKPNVETNQLALSTDLLPTFNTIANGNKLSSKIDGIDISSHLFSPNKVLNRPAVFWQISKRYKRSGNYSKISIPRPNPIVNEIVREGHWKLCALENELTALYNIQEDPYERWNLLQSHPEKAQELHKKLKDWLNEPREKQPYQKIKK